MRTALAKPLVGLTVGDLLLIELPHIPEDKRSDIAWNFTGFPHWWAMRGTEWHPVQTFQRQLREFRNNRCEGCGSTMVQNGEYGDCNCYRRAEPSPSARPSDGDSE